MRAACEKETRRDACASGHLLSGQSAASRVHALNTPPPPARPEQDAFAPLVPPLPRTAAAPHVVVCAQEMLDARAPLSRCCYVHSVADDHALTAEGTLCLIANVCCEFLMASDTPSAKQSGEKEVCLCEVRAAERCWILRQVTSKCQGGGRGRGRR